MHWSIESKRTMDPTFGFSHRPLGLSFITRMTTTWLPRENGATFRYGGKGPFPQLDLWYYQAGGIRSDLVDSVFSSGPREVTNVRRLVSADTPSYTSLRKPLPTKCRCPGEAGVTPYIPPQWTQCSPSGELEGLSGWKRLLLKLTARRRLLAEEEWIRRVRIPQDINKRLSQLLRHKVGTRTHLASHRLKHGRGLDTAKVPVGQLRWEPSRRMPSKTLTKVLRWNPRQ